MLQDKTKSFIRFRGAIAGAGFASGDRFVVGAWRESPFGPFADVMWSRPDGTRLLIVNDAPGEFLGRHYRFDIFRDEHVDLEWRESTFTVRANDLTLTLEVARRGLLSFVLRLRPRRLGSVPAWMVIEDTVLRPLVRPLLGSARDVRVRGRTAAGVRQWYALEDHRLVTSGKAVVGTADLGSVTVVDRRMGFGFSEFPARAAVVTLTSIFEDRTRTYS